MAGWAGFSDEELRKLQQKDQTVSAALGRGRRPAPPHRSRQQMQRERALQTAAQHNVGSGSPSLPREQQLTRPPQRDVCQPSVPAEAPAVKPAVEKPREEKPRDENLTVNHTPATAEESPPVVKELEKQEVELRERTRLEQLQHEQKMIEDNNKRKKALLAKTIAEKSKQTQQEAVKLKRIQKELQALDDMVSNDIGILRGRIEQASWDYSAARKRYEKAEAEYVTAKLDLQRKTDVKEQLTEHLCAIIQQNELRKAHKLEELMQRLQLHATEEELEMERQREEEEERRRSGGGVENPEEGKEEKGVRESGEATPGSTGDQGSAGEETTKQGADTAIRQGCPPVTEPKTADQDCKILENYLQGQALASAS
ncbi:RAB6-interacting golgin [Polymixia lowei]